MGIELNVADIYCGAGGLSEGFRQARLSRAGIEACFHTDYGVDKDTDCISTYRNAHFSDLAPERQELVAQRRSVIGLSGRDILQAAGVADISVVIGGPNCQGVSSAGLRNAGDPRNDMFSEFQRLVSELQPDWFVMENVPGLTHSNNRPLLQKIMSELAGIPGYSVAADVLLAADFGVPQLRYRLFVIGTRTGHPIRFPPPTHSRAETGLQAQLIPQCATYLTVGDAIRDLETIRPSVGIDRAIKWPERGRTIYNHVVPAMTPENIDRVKNVQSGEDWRSIPVGLLPERSFATRASDQKGAYGRLEWDQPAFTITGLASNVSAGPFIHPSQHRPISVREAARLQGFEDHYVFRGDVASLYRQVGNAVPPPLARAVAESVLLCHLLPREAEHFGTAGRITVEKLKKAAQGKAMPVLTPRILTGRNQASSRYSTHPSANKGKVISQAVTQRAAFAEDPESRVLVEGEDLDRVRREASLPGNMRAGKRARVILGYFEGKTLEQLREEAKVSDQSIKKWVDGFYRGGVDGWRAYHTPLSRIAGEDHDLLRRLEDAVAQVRDRDDCQAGQTPARLASPDSRPHMNSHLVSLIERFAGYSVEQLTSLVEARLERGIGTMYVGDLLALCEVLLEDIGNKERLDGTPGNGQKVAAVSPG